MTSNKTNLMFIVCILAVILATFVPGLSWLSSTTYIVILPVLVIWIWKSERRSLWNLGFQFDRGWMFRLAIGFTIGLAIPIFFLVIQLIGGWLSLIKRIDPIKGILSFLPLLFLKMILVVAIEEFVFRGFFLQPSNRKKGLCLAIVISSLLWSLGHLTSMVIDGLSPVSILIGLTTFFLWGTTLALCYLGTGKSLWLPYGLHLGINICFSLIGLSFIVQPDATQWWIGHPAWSPESGTVGVVVWLIFAVSVYWLTGIKRINIFAKNG